MELVRALVGGTLIGLAASLALVGHGRIAGVSSILGGALEPDDGRGFRIAFLLGLVGVGAIAAVVAPSAIGAPVRGLAPLALAGLLVGVGTTLGGGCTSGHGVCGLARGSGRSLAAVIAFMAVAMVTVLVAGGRA